MPEYCTKVEEIQLWDLDHQAKKIPAHTSSHSSRKHPKTRLIVWGKFGHFQLSAVTAFDVKSKPIKKITKKGTQSLTQSLDYVTVSRGFYSSSKY